MSPVPATSPLTSQERTEQASVSRRMLLSLLAGVLGLALNHFPVPVFGGVWLLLGPFFSLLIAIGYGPWSGALAGLLTGLQPSSLVLQPLAPVLFGAEGAIVGWLTRKRLSPLVAELLFWLLIGGPLVSGIYVFWLKQSAPIVELVVFKFALNGVVLVALADLIHRFSPIHRLLRVSPGGASLAFRRDLQRSFIQVMALPLFGLMLLFTHLTSQRMQEETFRLLKESSTSIAKRVDDHLHQSMETINSVAYSLDQLAVPLGKGTGRQLAFFHQNFPELNSMVAASRDGRIVAAIPERDSSGQRIADLGINISDREYFQQAIATGKPFVSHTFRGRVYGHDPIVAVSAPLRNSRGEIVGIIEGSLDFSRFAEFCRPVESSLSSDVIVLDDQSRIVYASPAMGYQPLQPIDMTAWIKSSADLPGGTAAVIKLLYIPGVRMPYMSRHSRDSLTGWDVFVIQPVSVIASQLQLIFFRALGILAAGMLLSVLIARITATRATAPLEQLVRRTQEFLPSAAGEASPKIESGAPREIQELVKSFDNMSSRLDKVLTGILPICANCKKIRDDAGQWQHVERFIRDRSEAQFTHGICPDCKTRLYGS